MNAHRNPQLAGLRPDRVKTWVVDGNEVSVGAARPEPQVFGDLHPGISRVDRVFEYIGHSLAKSSRVDALPVEVAEERDGPRVGVGGVKICAAKLWRGS